jgi:hypothetical protein
MPFQYRPYRNQYVGSITDLMGRGRDAEAQALITAANAQAQAAQVSGQAWGGAVQGIGNIVGAIPGQMQAAEDREYLVGQRERLAEAQGREDLERANRDRASAIFANQVSGVTPSRLGGIPGMAYKETPAPVEGQPVEGPNSMAPVQPLSSRQLGPAQHPYQVKQNGAWLFDIEGFHRAAAEAGPGVLEQAGPFIDQMSRMNTWRKGVTESAIAEAKQTAIFLSSLSDDSQLLRAAPEAIRMFEGVFDQIALDSLTDLAEQGDAVGLRKALNAVTGREDQWLNIGEDTDLFNPRTGERIKGPSAAPTPPTGDALDRAEWQRQVDAGLTTDSYPRWLAKEKRLPPSQERRLVPVYDSAGNRVYGEPRAGDPVVEPTGRPLTSGDANRISELDTSLDDIAVLGSTLFPDAIGADVETEATTGTLAAAGAALPNWITEVFGVGADAKGRQAVIDRVKQVIGKALEGGVLRKEDEYKYTKILPTIQDTPQVAKVKLDGLRDALTLRRERLLESLDDAGYNVSEFYARGRGAGTRDRQQHTDPATGETFWIIWDENEGAWFRE